MMQRQPFSKHKIERIVFTLTLLALAVCTWLNWAWRPCTLSQFAAVTGGSHEVVHPLLRSVFLCVTFKWNIEKVVYLNQVLTRASSYPTHVDVCIVTDVPDNVASLLDFWDFTQARVCGVWHEVNTTADAFALVWEHRSVMENATAHGPYTTFLYIEDDTDIGWPALSSWAADTEVLEPMGFLRGFWRTEISFFTGRPVFMDTFWQCDLSTWNRTLEAVFQPSSACAVANPEDNMWRWREVPDGCHHQHYISPPAPYFGMWIATRNQLLRFMTSELWEKQGAMAFDKPTILHRNQNTALWPWGPPERSTSMIQFVDVPPGFWSRSVVPYDPKRKVLLPAAQIGHSRNAWSSHVKHQINATSFFQ